MNDSTQRTCTWLASAGAALALTLSAGVAGAQQPASEPPPDGPSADPATAAPASPPPSPSSSAPAEDASEPAPNAKPAKKKARKSGGDEAASAAPTPSPDEETLWVDDEGGKTLPYYDGSRVPKGFRLDTSPRYGLVAGGATTLGTLWTVSFIAAIALDKEGSSSGDPNFDDMYWPMFIPVVGPFITIGTADSSGTGAAILGLDGAMQAAGLGLMIAGLVSKKSELIPQRKVRFTPRTSMGSVGLDISGSF